MRGERVLCVHGSGSVHRRFYDIGPNDSSTQMQQSPEERPEIAGAKHVEQEQAH